MKIHTLRSRLLVGVAFVAASGLAIPAMAGPGLQYWRKPSPSDRTTPTVAPATQSEDAMRACTNARLVSVTETKPAWHNGRGPLTSVEDGKKLICTSCDTPMIVMKPSWLNGRGPMAPIAIKGTHDCTKNGCTPRTSVASVD